MTSSNEQVHQNNPPTINGPSDREESTLEIFNLNSSTTSTEQNMVQQKGLAAWGANNKKR